MTEVQLDNELSMLLSTVSEMVGTDGDEQRRRWNRVQAKFPRTADAIVALMRLEVDLILSHRPVGRR